MKSSKKNTALKLQTTSLRQLTTNQLKEMVQGGWADCAPNSTRPSCLCGC